MAQQGAEPAPAGTSIAQPTRNSAMTIVAFRILVMVRMI
jgi:hypothetical protein